MNFKILALLSFSAGLLLITNGIAYQFRLWGVAEYISWNTVFVLKITYAAATILISIGYILSRTKASTEISVQEGKAALIIVLGFALVIWGLGDIPLNQKSTVSVAGWDKHEDLIVPGGFPAMAKRIGSENGMAYGSQVIGAKNKMTAKFVFGLLISGFGFNAIRRRSSAAGKSDAKTDLSNPLIVLPLIVLIMGPPLLKIYSGAKQLRGEGVLMSGQFFPKPRKRDDLD